jgi:hypothetical protein
MSNYYNITHIPPVTEAAKIPPELEQLAQALVKGGRMRVDAFDRINFVRYPINNEVLMISHRELYDSKLVPRTISLIGEDKLEIMRREISTNQPVPIELELKLARLLVQAIDPVVIKILILEGTEVFISYSHNIGDLLDMESWKAHGANSGMQSLDTYESRVFVSCDGDPFATSDELKEHAKYSMSRFMVIAAQELGHYSDVRRDTRYYSRFSLHPYINKARLKDLERVESIIKIMKNLDLSAAAKMEKDIEFYKKHKKYFTWLKTRLRSYLTTTKIQRQAMSYNIKIANLHSARDLQIMLADMKFNLHPKAPAYEREDPREELMVVNIEALARVPQQVVKWGHETTRFMYPNMYKAYYAEVIPSCKKYYRKRIVDQSPN